MRKHSITILNAEEMIKALLKCPLELVMLTLNELR